MGSGGPIRLDLEVTDPEVVAELARRAEGEERDRYALAALRIGVLSLRAAGGQIDAAAIKEAGQALIADIKALLSQRATELTRDMASEFDKYFNAERGVLSRRISSLVEDGGELERKLDDYVGEDNSVVAKALAQQLGEKSPIFRMLSPTDSDGLLAHVEKKLKEELDTQRKAIVGAFDLNDEKSALRRLKANLEDTLRDYEKRNEGFRTEVIKTLTAIKTRREEEQRSTRHGGVFEDELGGVLSREAQRLGDVCEATGNTIGLLPRNKKGDYVIEMGADSAAPGAKIAWEAKEDQSYNVKKALEEIDEVRRNRGAQVGVFVFSKRTAPEDIDPFFRHGDDILVVWDAENGVTDIRLQAAYSAARCLVARESRESEGVTETVTEIERAVRAVEEQIKHLDTLEGLSQEIVGKSDKIIERVGKMKRELNRQVSRLDDYVKDLKT